MSTPGTSTRLSDLFARVTRNSFFGCFLIAGAVLRLFVWLAYKPAILILGDSYFYLRAATLGTGMGADRPFLYSLLFIKPLLAVGGLSFVTAVQHVLGLGIASALYAFQRRLNVHPVLAALGVFLVLLDAYQLNLEQHILTEALFEACVVGGLLALLWFAKGPVWLYALAAILLGMSCITRFVGLAVLPIALIFLCFERVGWLRLCATIGGFILPVLLYGALFQGSSGSLKYQVAARLYGKVVSFADCRGVGLSSQQSRLCIGKPPSERYPYYSVWSRLGGSPLNKLHLSHRVEGDLVASFDERFILRQPLDYAAATGRDFLRFFSWPSTRALPRPDVRRWQFFNDPGKRFASTGKAGTYPNFRTSKGSPPPEFGLHERFHLDRAVATKLKDYQHVFYARGPLLAALVLLGLVGALVGTNPPGIPRSARSACLLLVASGLGLYLFPAAFTTFHFRYVISGLPLLGAAGAMGASLLWCRFAPW